MASEIFDDEINFVDFVSIDELVDFGIEINESTLRCFLMLLNGEQ